MTTPPIIPYVPSPALVVQPRIQDKWETFWADRQITLQPKPLFTATDRIFTVGSCFAEEIKRALTGLGVDCLPHYDEVTLDRTQVRLENDEGEGMPAHLQHYNTFTVRYEFERIAGLWQQADEDYWRVRRGSPWAEAALGEPAWQDPYRRRLYGRSISAIQDFNARLNTAYRQGFEQASTFFFTFGMTEVFRQKHNGLIVAQRPAYAGGGGESETDFYQSSYQENYDNVARIIGIVRARHPQAPIVLTVSPVPLQRSFSGRDVAIANAESKAILRVVMGAVARDFPNVTYFPSYEAVTQAPAGAAWEADGRHVQRPFVAMLMQTFIAAHMAGTPVELAKPAGNLSQAMKFS